MPSPVDDTKSSVTQEISLLDDVSQFIKARDPGAYKEFYPVTLDDFLSLKNKSEISYIYLAQARTLFIKGSSDAHESLRAAIRDQFYDAMLKQQHLNPPLAKWQLHTNRSLWYNDDNEQYIPDIALFFRNTALFDVEVVFTQPWDPLRHKINRMLLDKDVQGVLVIKLTENSDKWTWSKPTRAATYNDFVTFDDFDAEMQRAQTADEYGALSMIGFEWVKRVTCEVYVFPGEWQVGFADPQAYPLNGDREAFTNLNVQLADIWSDIVQDIGRQLSCPVNPIEFSIDWGEVHKRLVDGLRYTAFNRYLGWFGAERHRVRDEAEGRLRTRARAP